MYQNVEKSLTSKFLASILALAFAAMLALAGCANETAPADNAAGADNAAVEQSADGAKAADAEGGAAADAAESKVTVSVTMPEGASASSESAEVSIPAEGTVYDALMATGWDVQAEDSDYGKYVTSINGIANGSEGEMSGWVFTVNNEQVMEGCDVCKLADGDTVEWTFFV
ncbi:DUF4430 domain-containing protein [Adlercreutzia caecimuris]|jgi:hypothetical protein|uniref:DUF4430 domain-containing protein n=1 Tax=Adlercreutzia caecimuris TaxID=671266 RepID=UPI00242BEE96|nr:DUF4430 domain-containing protein [Adlercreutzia caecimuris]MCI9207966.1 DUF4430 domain-containing protein [Adlercreutzia caecimuris]